jgi:hypothetical protein
MTELAIQILPSGEIMVERTSDKKVNDALLSLLGGIVENQTSLADFLKAAEECEQVFGDEPLCG